MKQFSEHINRNFKSVANRYGIGTLICGIRLDLRLGVFRT